MLDFPLEELVFVVTAVGGGGALLLASVGNGATRRRLNEAGGPALLAPPLLAFVALFGVGRLVASRLVDVQGVQAILAASGAGIVGLGLALALRGTERRAED